MEEPTATVFAQPDVSSRPFTLAVERPIQASAEAIYLAWTRQIDHWFASHGSALMKGVVDSPFFFETQFAGQGHAHYGRFLRLRKDRLVEMTWVTAATSGHETIVTVELEPEGVATLVRLTHAGFPDQGSCERHREAWPHVLAQLEERLARG